MPSPGNRSFPAFRLRCRALRSQGFTCTAQTKSTQPDEPLRSGMAAEHSSSDSPNGAHTAPGGEGNTSRMRVIFTPLFFLPKKGALVYTWGTCRPRPRAAGDAPNNNPLRSGHSAPPFLLPGERPSSVSTAWFQ